MSLLIKSADNHSEGRFYFYPDGKNDFGIYQSSKFSDGASRPIYICSKKSKREAEALCSELNSGEKTIEDIHRMIDEEIRLRDFREYMEAERKFDERFR